jgi:hypothetical protein
MFTNIYYKCKCLLYNELYLERQEVYYIEYYFGYQL